MNRPNSRKAAIFAYIIIVLIICLVSIEMNLVKNSNEITEEKAQNYIFDSSNEDELDEISELTNAKVFDGKSQID